MAYVLIAQSDSIARNRKSLFKTFEVVEPAPKEGGDLDLVPGCKLHVSKIRSGDDEKTFVNVVYPDRYFDLLIQNGWIPDSHAVAS